MADALDGDDGTDDDGDDGNEAAEKALGLKVAIERAFIFIGRVNSTADRLEDEGYTIDPAIRDRLEEANNSLTALKENLEYAEISTEEAAQELARIREFLGQTMGLLRSTAIKEHNEDRAVRFLGQVQNRIQGLNVAISKLQERLGAAKTERAREALGKVAEKLSGIRDLLAEGNVEDAVNDLDGVVEGIDDGLDQLDGEDTSTVLKTMNRLEAKIRVLNATAERLAKKGADTSEIKEELRNAEALLSEMMDLLEEGDTEAAETLLEEAEEHLEEAGSLIRPIQIGRRPDRSRENKHGPQP